MKGFSQFVVSAALLGATLLPMAAFANNDQGINWRLHHQHQRIAQGVHSDQLTRREKYLVSQRDRNIHYREEFDRRHDHGNLTAGEDRRLNHSLNNNSHEIYRFKHNSTKRS